MHSKSLPGWVRAVGTAAAALAFLLVYEWAVYRVPVWEIFLPVSSWSDEVIYSKQLAAAVRYGAPQGYFGFNESHAAVGTYAAWGPAVFFVYALPGLIFRGQNAFLWCNLLFAVLGWTFFARAARLDWKRQAVFAAALAAFGAPIRYIFSAMQEPLHYAFVLAVLGCGILVRRDKNRTAWAAQCILCAAATLVRPYMAVLWLYPLALAWKNKRRAAVCVAGGAVSLGGTLVLMSKFYAPYFFTNVDMGPLQELAHGHPIEAVKDVARKLLGALQTVVQTMASDLTQRSGGHYLLFFLLLAVVVGCLLYDKRHKRPVFWKALAAVTAVIVFLALMLMYRPGEGSRHTLILDVLLLASLLAEDVRPAAATAAASVVLALAGVFSLAKGYDLPRYSAAWDAEVQSVQAALEESQTAVDSADPWDRTAAYAFGDDVHCGLLYGVPDGMGIQFDEADYLADAANPVYARYVFTAADSDTARRLETDGWTILYQSDKCVIYER